ncbi:MAG: hypothetical protein SH859_02975 [Hyphomicrobium aestuarii]|nr:hypothetical protein [Hyphomicrobium aestuarii]
MTLPETLRETLPETLRGDFPEMHLWRLYQTVVADLRAGEFQDGDGAVRLATG